MATQGAFANYFRDDQLLFLDSQTKEEAILALIDLLDRKGWLLDSERFTKAIFDREKLVSTGIGLGLALPHAKLPGYKDFFVAIGIHPRGIDWGSLDGMPVRIIFLIGGPDDKQTQYLQLLSHLTTLMRDEGRRKKILQSQSAADIMAFFR